MRARSKRPNQTGRNDKTARFVMLPIRVLESAAFANIDTVARSLLLDLLSLYDGTNNGSLFLSTGDATARLGRSDERSAMRAFEQLVATKLIEQTKGAHFQTKTGDGSRARCWRLSWLIWPESPNRSRRCPMWDFESFQGSGKAQDRRLKALAKYRKAKSSGKFAAVDCTVLEAFEQEKRQLPAVKSATAYS